MPAKGSRREWQMRERLIAEAARIMAEEGVSDFLTAKRKAAERLGAADTRHMPRNIEVQEALQAYQRLFQSDTQPRRLRRLREAAAEAMRFFRSFRPRLVGPVLTGTAGMHSEVNLHLFADTPEDVAVFLLNEHIRFEPGDTQYRYAEDRTASYPSYRIEADDVPFRLTVFPPAGIRQAPLAPVDGRPMHRADLAEVEALLAGAEYQPAPD